jgi:hypothetical protein
MFSDTEAEASQDSYTCTDSPAETPAASGIRVLVCGGRQFTDTEYLADVPDALRIEHGPIAVVIHGAAVGPDGMAGEWAKARGIPVQDFPADWTAFKNRRSAGPIRNQQMLTEGKPDLVVAFPGGRGTTGMVRLAREAGVEVIEAPERP